MKGRNWKTMKKTLWLAGAIAALAVVVTPLTASAAEEGWQQDSNGWWYQFEDGTYAKDGIYSAKDDETTKYLFDENGYMQTGWYFDNDNVAAGWSGDWYYCDEHGVVQTGWLKSGDTWYYLDEDFYYMYTGRCTIDEVDYYFTSTGAMITGWYNRDPASTYGKWCYANADGSLYDGWLSYNGSWYYIDNGYMKQNSYVYKYQATDGTISYEWSSGAEIVEKYYVGRDGVMIDGWYYTEYEDATGYKSNSWKYGHAGVVKEGWIYDNGWYYTDSEGTMYRDGSYTITGDTKAPEFPDADDYRNASGYIDWDAYDAACTKYYVDNTEYQRSRTFIFDVNGKMVEGGWYGSKDTYGTTWYYANGDGTAYTGWVNEGGTYYYIQRGVMLTNTVTPDGYYVDANGVWK